jgi:cytochrome c oxidase subunit IV
VTVKQPTEGHAHQAHATEGTYFSVFVLLAVLTVIELLVVYLPGIKVPLLLALSFTKAWLVVRYFMHLKYENRIMSLAFFAPLVIAIIVTIALQILKQSS